MIGAGSLALLLALAPAAPEEKRAPAPDFVLKTLEGKRLELSKHAGRVVVISFWATWCGPCMQELAVLDRLYRERKDKGLTVLAISTDGPETAAQVRTVVKRNRWSMPVLLDAEGSVSARLNPRGTNPYTLFVDRRGKIALRHEGWTTGDEKSYERTIAALLAEP